MAPEQRPDDVQDVQDITRWLNDLAPDLAPCLDVNGADGADGPESADAAPAIGDVLFARLYADLHRVARGHMFRESADHTLSATALTHEAWFRMNGQTRTRWASRSHFLAVASIMMRRILVNHAMARRADKRDAILLSLTAADNLPSAASISGPAGDVVAVHEALLAFEAVDARAARVVELKFFGGMENSEIAEALDISVATVKREWRVARAWLSRALGAG